MKFSVFALLLSVATATAAHAGCGEDDAAQALKHYAYTRWGMNCSVTSKYIQTDGSGNEYFQGILQRCVSQGTFGGIFWVILKEVNDGNCILASAPKRILPQ